MLNPNGVQFNDYVYIYTADMFKIIANGQQLTDMPTSPTPTPAYAPGTHTFELIEGQDPGVMFLNAPEQNNMIEGTFSKMSIFGSITSNAGTTVTYTQENANGEPNYINFKEIYDFKATNIAGIEKNYWVARISVTGSDQDTFISNFGLEQGETYELVGRDATMMNPPDDPIPTEHDGYQSSYDTGNYVPPGDPDDKPYNGFGVQLESGMRIEDTASPTSPTYHEDAPTEIIDGQEVGYSDFVAYLNVGISTDPDDRSLNLAGEDVIVRGVFRSYDNDDYFSDGATDYTESYRNDLTQLGQFYLENDKGELVAQWNDGKPTAFQAERILAAQDQDSDFFQFIQINWFNNATGSEDKTTEQASTIWVTTSAREVIRDPVTGAKVQVNYIPQPGRSYGYLADDGSPGFNNVNIPDGEEQYARYSKVAVCFTPGTLIKTTYGEVCVEDLAPGDEVLTRDNGYQKIRWIGKKHISAEELQESPNLRPVRIRKGSLGPNLPEQNLVVSQQHRILVSSKIAERMFGSREVLIPAKNLLAMKGVELVEPTNPVTYVHFLFDYHEVVVANGVLTESLFTGPEALKTVSPEARTEILGLFPELAQMDYKPLPCRTLAGGSKARRLAVRHNANKLPLIAAEEEN